MAQAILRFKGKQGIYLRLNAKTFLPAQRILLEKNPSSSILRKI